MPLQDPRMSASAIVLQGTIANLGAAGNTAYFVAPESGYIKEIHVARSAAGGAGTSDLTLTTQDGAVAPVMTMLTGGAAGDVDSLELARTDANNAVVAGEGFSIASDGDFAGTPIGFLTVVLEAY